RLEDSFKTVIRVRTKAHFLGDAQIEVHEVWTLACIATCSYGAVGIGLRVAIRIEAEQEIERMTAGVRHDRRDGHIREYLSGSATFIPWRTHDGTDDKPLALIE